MLGEEQLSVTEAAAARRVAGEGRRAFIVGLGGQALSRDEAAFLEKMRPCGVIIFTRNYACDGQLQDLIADARDASGGDDLLVLVDQEGGRVQRLRGATWPDLPPASAFGALYQQDPREGIEAAEVCSRWLAERLRGVGINTNCVPCLDIPVEGADGVIGDRAFSDRPDVVVALGGAVAFGMMAGGVLPVMKHVPGHGRAVVDSHRALPVVDTELATLISRDFSPFAANSGLPAAMTAHVTFSAIDDEQPASISERVTRGVIREQLGFHGLLMSDDVSMQALSGSIAQRAQRVIDAGSDVVLHCNGVMSEMREVAQVAPVLSGEALVRYRRCIGIASQVTRSVDEEAAHVAIARVRQATGSLHAVADRA